MEMDYYCGMTKQRELFYLYYPSDAEVQNGFFGNKWISLIWDYSISDRLEQPL